MDTYKMSAHRPQASNAVRYRGERPNHEGEKNRRILTFGPYRAGSKSQNRSTASQYLSALTHDSTVTYLDRPPRSPYDK